MRTLPDRRAFAPLLLALVGLTAASAAAAVAQGAARRSAPSVSLGLASGMLEPTCSHCGVFRVRSNRTLLASLDLPLSRVPAVVTMRGLYLARGGRRFSAVALGVEGMLLGRWVRVGAGIGGGGCRDSILAITPPHGPAHPAWTTALAPVLEFHATTAVPLLRHVELGPVLGFVTSLGGFPAFPISSDRAVLYWGLQLTAH